MTAIVDVCLSQPLKLRRVHLCLVCVNPESVDNHNSFVEALPDSFFKATI